MNQNQKNMLASLAAIFFISGLSALIYQVCWQRLLFTGANSNMRCDSFKSLMIINKLSKLL